MEQKFKLWDNSDLELSYFPTLRKSSDAAVIIFPGGAYKMHADYEGEGYAQLINTFGMDAFVLKYRVAPNRFPLPLLDARRAVRFVRHMACELGLDSDKIAVMGSSAGGHLAALTSTYLDKIEGEGVDEIDSIDFLPSAQILCYPVISSDEAIGHIGSFVNLLGEEDFDKKDSVSPEKLVSDATPRAFIWHTAKDQAVNVRNSYAYAAALAAHGVHHELHVFPDGVHGLGLGEPLPYVSEWTSLLRRWLTLNGFLRF